MGSLRHQGRPRPRGEGSETQGEAEDCRQRLSLSVPQFPHLQHEAAGSQPARQKPRNDMAARMLSLCLGRAQVIDVKTGNGRSPRQRINQNWDDVEKLAWAPLRRTAKSVKGFTGKDTAGVQNLVPKCRNSSNVHQQMNESTKCGPSIQRSITQS